MSTSRSRFRTLVAVLALVLALGALVFALLRARNVLGDHERADGTEVAPGNAAPADSQPDDARARFDALGPTSPLREYLAFVGNDALRDLALAEARTLPNRQAEAEAMLAEGSSLVLDQLQNLDLEVSPALCGNAAEALRRHAERLREEGTGGKPFAAAAVRVERHAPTLELLSSRGCDLRTALDAYERVALGYPADPQRERFTARLSTLRSRTGVGR